MPIAGLPSFSAGILTASSLNSIVTALETKFSGQIVTGDISWPLTAGGDLNMAQYQLLNVSKFWNAYNAAERAAGETLQNLIDDVSSDGGGIVVFPGNYTEAIPAAGITVPASVYLVGEGESSVLQMHASASDDMIRLGSSSHNSGLVQLKLNGNTSVNQIFVDIDSCDYVRIHGVHFATHGTSEFIKVYGAASALSVQQCRFEGNGDTNAQNQIQLVACVNTRIVNNHFQEWTNTAVTATPVGTAVSNTVFAGNQLTRTATTQTAMSANAPINFNNSGAIASDGLVIVDNTVSGGGAGVGGVYIDDFNSVIVSQNFLRTTHTEPALLARSCSVLSIFGNTIRASGGDGIVIGGTNGTEAASTADVCDGFAVTNNQVTTSVATAGKGAALIIVTSTAAINGAAAGNRLQTSNCNVIQVWNVTANEMRLSIVGNFCVSGASNKGFASYTDMGTTNTGNIGGSAASYWFTMVGNTIPNSVSGTDFTHDTSDKTVVANNNL